jgi:RecJ-like exonuclease
MAQVEICEGCIGNGYVRCPICQGKGKIKKESNALDTNYIRVGGETVACHECHGTGRLLCTVCGGVGKVKVEKPASTGFRNLF